MKQTKPPLMASINGPPRNPTTSLVAGLILAAVLGAQAASSGPPALNPRVYSRPVTPTDKTIYKLASTTEVSGGLSAIGVGTLAYLEAHINSAVSPTNILSVTWALTSKPLTSSAYLTNSPLGTNVPIYTPADQLAFQIVGARTTLRPDVEGQYTVTATISTSTYGTTNVAITLTAGTYLGWSQGCIACHSGGLVAPNMTNWLGTLHATKFSRSIDGLVGSYSLNCVSCHTLGYDNNALAVNGGFDDVMAQTGWKFPTVLTNGNWAGIQATNPALANVANIQCENCHGPGSKHLIYNGVLGNTNAIAINWDVGNCGQCHDATSHHIKVPEWKNSKHAIAPTDPSGPGREGCVICHTAMGYAARGTSSTNTTYLAITCVACHDPHDATNPHQLRTVAPVQLADGSTADGYGTGQLCMSCHHARTSGTNTVATFTGGRFGPHHGPQSDLFLGLNGYTYGKNIPSSAHRDVIEEACVTCHMQPTPAATDPKFLQTGGHTWNMSCNVGGTNYNMTLACQQCHGPITDFDLVREDYNGDGIVEGVQTEVQHLMDQLSTLLPPNTLVKTSLSPTATWTKSQLAAAWNWSLISEDRSHGVHNAAYAVGLLKASITDLTGDPAGLGPKTAADLAFYAWQVKYFGSATAANASPNATPANDGVPNWVKYSLGLNPLVAGTAGVDGGMVWTSGSSLGGNTPTNTIQIYKAAEVTFNTEVGKTYQVQACSSISSGWQPVSTNIVGTGTAISFLTPTRQNVQQYFRVAHTP